MHCDDDIDWGPPPISAAVALHADPQSIEDPPIPMDKRRIRYSEFGEAPLLLRDPPPRPTAATGAEAEAPCYNDDYVDDEDEDQEKHFMATKPWLGAIYPPKRFIRDEANPHKVFDENYNNWEAPPVTFKLDYVMGYKARDSRDNLHWVDYDTVVFPAAAVGIVFDIKSRDQFFYFGHTDDIITLDFHRGRKLVASGSLGANWDCQLCIWNIESQSFIVEKQNLTRIHQFGVVAVNFNPSGTLVCCLGLDEHHSVAVVDVDTGLIVAKCPADKNRVLHCKFALCENVDRETYFVTIGVCHICFWRPSDECGAAAAGASHVTANLPDGVDRPRTVLQITGAPLERRLFWERGNTSTHSIDKACALSLEFTAFHTLVGWTDGVVLMFNTATHDLIRVLNVTIKTLKELGPDASEVLINQLRVFSIVRLVDYKEKKGMTPRKDSPVKVDTVAIATAEGLVHFYTFQSESGAKFEVEARSNVTADGQPLDLNMLDSRTATEKQEFVNCARSMSWEPTLQQLLVGTTLTTIYILDIRKCMKTKPVSQVLLAGHYGDIKDPFVYGELWGIDTHPSKQMIISCADDCTVRLWELKESVEVARFDVGRKAYKCSYSGDGSMVAVCFRGGGFCVLNGTLTAAYIPLRIDSKGCSTDISFSPDGRYLALGIGRNVDIYELIRKGRKQNPISKEITYDAVGVKLLGSCCGHTSEIDAFDWSLTSNLIQCCSIGYEILYFEIPSCDQVTGVKALAEQLWYTQTCTLGWSVQGIWPRYADGTDVNAVGKSRSENFLTTVDDYGLVKLYNFPCIGSGLDRKTGKLNIRPKCHEFRGHSSHVTNTAWTFDDTYCITTGGADLSMFVWEVKYGAYPKPKHFLNAARVEKIRPHPQLGLVEVTDDELKAQRTVDSAVQPPLPSCYMCDFVYTRDVEQECPRCFASRAIPQPVLRKAWKGKEKFLSGHPTSDFIKFIREQRRLMKEERIQKKTGIKPSPTDPAVTSPAPAAATSSGTTSRYRQPTQTFARYTKQQQQQRKTIEEAPRLEATWKPGSVKPAPAGNIGSDSDEEEIAKKIREAAAIQRKNAQATAAKSVTTEGPPQPKTKKTSGPDLRDY
jgi:WD40 repeat protein